jgi:hypothetical protein
MMPDWEQKIHDPRETKLFKALSDPKWDFRTIPGLSESTGIPEPEVAAILAKYPSLIRRSPVPDRKGRSLFTLQTRRPKPQEIFAEIRSFVTKST